MDKVIEYGHIALDKIVFFLPKVILAAVVFWVGFKIVKKIAQILATALDKAGFSDSIRPFLLSMAKVILKGIILFIIASIIGADLTGLFAILAAAGFAIGMSLQGSLGNFASGILILTLKPYKVGDWIQVHEKFGQVEEIGIFSTNVTTPGNKTLIVPNSQITDTIVTNFSNKKMIRLELKVTMPYSESFPRVEKIIREALLELPQIKKEPEPDIGISDFDSHSVQLLVRPFVKPDEYWEVTFKANKAIKAALNENNIKVAYSEGMQLGEIGE